LKSIFAKNAILKENFICYSRW